MEALERVWLNVIAPTLAVLAFIIVMGLLAYWLGPS